MFFLDKSAGKAKTKPRNHCGIGVLYWSRLRDSNSRPADYKSAALPTELSRHINCAFCSARDILRCGGRFVKPFFEILCDPVIACRITQKIASVLFGVDIHFLIDGVDYCLRIGGGEVVACVLVLSLRIQVVIIFT